MKFSLFLHSSNASKGYRKKILVIRPLRGEGRVKAGPLKKKEIKKNFFCFFLFPIDNITFFTFTILLSYGVGLQSHSFPMGLLQYLERKKYGSFSPNFLLSFLSILRLRKQIVFLRFP